MEKATISEIKNHLSEYLRKVRNGEPVLILDRTEVVARLERVEHGDHPDERLVRLERDGRLQRPRHPIPMDLLRRPAPKSRQSVLEALLEERMLGR